MNVEPRFWSKVAIADAGECWLWTASTGSHGYGAFGMGRRVVLAHRLSYELANGPIPGGLFVCHTCDRRRCVNPRHLFLGDVRDNAADMIAKGRSTHGSRNPNSKLTEMDASEIRRLREDGMRMADLADRFGVSRSTISTLLSGKTWRRAA